MAQESRTAAVGATPLKHIMQEIAGNFECSNVRLGYSYCQVSGLVYSVPIGLAFFNQIIQLIQTHTPTHTQGHRVQLCGYALSYANTFVCVCATPAGCFAFSMCIPFAHTHTHVQTYTHTHIDNTVAHIELLSLLVQSFSLTFTVNFVQKTQIHLIFTCFVRFFCIVVACYYICFVCLSILLQVCKSTSFSTFSYSRFINNHISHTPQRTGGPALASPLLLSYAPSSLSLSLPSLRCLMLLLLLLPLPLPLPLPLSLSLPHCRYRCPLSACAPCATFCN